MKTRTCTEGVARGRLKKAEPFYTAAATIRDLAAAEEDVGDAYVTLCVHAGIAASDAICCAALGEHAQGESHVEAVQLLRRVRPDGASSAPHSRSSSVSRRGRATAQNPSAPTFGSGRSGPRRSSSWRRGSGRSGRADRFRRRAAPVSGSDVGLPYPANADALDRAADAR